MSCLSPLSGAEFRVTTDLDMEYAEKIPHFRPVHPEDLVVAEQQTVSSKTPYFVEEAQI